MTRFASRVGWLGALWAVACATAENGEPPSTGDQAVGGSSVGGRASAGSPSATGGSAGSSASIHGGSPGQAGGAFGGSVGGSGNGGHSALAGSGGAPASGGLAGGTSPGPVFESGACADSPTMSLKYMHSNSNPKQITGQFQLSNLAGASIALADLKIRYFFSNEETSGWSTAIYDSKLEGGSAGYRAISGTTLTVSPLGTSLPGADSYFEVAFASSLSIENGAVGTVSWDLQPHSYNPPDQDQSNDYSYDAGAVAFEVWDHVAIYQGATLVWGCLPKSTDSGSGGSGGASAGSGGVSAGSGGVSAGSGGASAGSGGASAGSGGASGDANAGSAGLNAGSGG